MIINFIEDLHSLGHITRDMKNALVTEKARTPEFYLLPKIHKKTSPPLGRPIVSGNGSPTKKISAFVDFLLKPYVPLIQLYVRDTNHVLEHLSLLKRLGPHTILAFLDVSSLYTNIPGGDPGMWAVLRTPLQTLECEISNSEILRLLEMVLLRNSFRFNGHHFLQVGGTAMGTRVAPTFANIYMDSFECTHVYPYSLRPRLWLCFIDDILLIWDHGMDELKLFIEFLNKRHPNIKFTEEISPKQVSFLDILIAKSPDGEIVTDLYSKTTDALHFHPHQIL